ncbi:MAG: hypothetical protein JKY62_16920 [Desulfocapsa sp.]|nr:hypothetical protein [Desulfocapsa sp.]
MFDHIKVIDEIALKLLHLNKEIYHSSGTAPKLAVYLHPEFSRMIMQSIALVSAGFQRDMDFVGDSVIMGFPVYVVSENEENHPDYAIVLTY